MMPETIKTVENNSGDRRVVFYKIGDTGMIRYDVDRYFVPAPEDEGEEIGWLNDSMSGLFANIEDAEKDAVATVDWLNDSSSDSS